MSFISLRPSPPRGVKTYEVGFGDYSKERDKWKYVVSAFRAKQIVKTIKPDILHAHYVTSAGIASWIINHPATIVTVHGSDLVLGYKSRLWRTLLRKIFRQVACVNVVSDDLKKIAMRLNVPEKKIAVVNVGIDTESFNFKSHHCFSPVSQLKLVNTRCLEPIYDHSTIIDALEILHNKGINYHMTFVGNGSLLKNLTRIVNEKGLNNKISFIGGTSIKQIPRYLHENDIYLSASLSDGASLCLMEAMATGIFPIVSDIPANSAWIKNGENGFLHPVGDPMSIANSIEKVLNMPDFQLKVSIDNRKLVLENGSREKNMNKLEVIYNQVLK